MKKVGVFSSNVEDSETSNTLLFSIKEETLDCSYIAENGTKETVEIEVLNYAVSFNERNRGIINESILQKRTVTIIGLGSGGSAIAVDLVRCGVTNLILVEFDSIDVNNLCRSVYDLSDVGRKKTDALYEKLLRVNPMVNVQIHDLDFLEMDFEQQMEIIESSDLIIEATDNPNTKRLINGLAHKTTPVLYPAVYDRGKGGDILLTLPGLPCWECVFSTIWDEMKKDEKRGQDYQTGQAKPMPALIADIQVVVARTVKIALAILADDEENSFFEKVTEAGCSMLFISNDKDCFDSETPFQEAWAETTVNPECICQTN